MRQSAEGAMVAEAACRILSAIPMATYDAVAAGHWPAALWAEVEEAGLPLALVNEEGGGFGLPLADGLELVRLTGALAVPLPLAETMIANHLLARAGIRPTVGPVTLTDVVGRLEGDDLAGRVDMVPWGRHCTVIAPVSDGVTLRLARVAPSVRETHLGIENEPLDDLDLRGNAETLSRAPVTEGAIRAAGAAMRAIQLAGAIESLTAMTIEYVGQREQFGRALGGFQVVQHQVAQMAGEAAAARVAADIAAESFAAGDDDISAIAAAKVRTGEAAGKVAAMAHQLHGAMGFTHEHRLHLFTRRLWAWRDSFGGETQWSMILGRKLAPAGRDVWPAITAI